VKRDLRTPDATPLLAALLHAALLLAALLFPGPIHAAKVSGDGTGLRLNLAAEYKLAKPWSATGGGELRLDQEGSRMDKLGGQASLDWRPEKWLEFALLGEWFGDNQHPGWYQKPMLGAGTTMKIPAGPLRVSFRHRFEHTFAWGGQREVQDTWRGRLKVGLPLGAWGVALSSELFRDWPLDDDAQATHSFSRWRNRFETSRSWCGGRQETTLGFAVDREWDRHPVETLPHLALEHRWSLGRAGNSGKAGKPNQ
jgi:hypothetical protein